MLNQPRLQEDAHHPWTVIVRDGYVFRRYRTDRAPADTRQGMITELCSGDLDVYQVDPSKESPPEEGQPVDPVKLGWTSLSLGACRTDESKRT